LPAVGLNLLGLGLRLAEHSPYRAADCGAEIAPYRRSLF
jgi:hypothetical protein